MGSLVEPVTGAKRVPDSSSANIDCRHLASWLVLIYKGDYATITVISIKRGYL